MTIAVTPIEVLLVEDNPADVRLTVEAFKDAGILTRLSVAHDGAEALVVLGERSASEAGLPDIVLLDLNLPRMDGRELLEKMKSDARLRHIPVVVLTTSQADEDIARSYELGANAFIKKPVEVDQFFGAMASFVRFWLDTAKLWRS